MLNIYSVLTRPRPCGIPAKKLRWGTKSQEDAPVRVQKQSFKSSRLFNVYEYFKGQSNTAKARQNPGENTVYKSSFFIINTHSGAPLLSPAKEKTPIKVTLRDGKVIDGLAWKTTPYEIASSIRYKCYV